MTMTRRARRALIEGTSGTSTRTACGGPLLQPACRRGFGAMPGCTALALLLWAGPAPAEEVVRHTVPGSDGPISRAVEVPGGVTMVYLGGTVPTPMDQTAAISPTGDYGNTQVQTVSVLRSIEATLADLGLSMDDVVTMQVFLVAPDGADAVDVQGFMQGYAQIFGTADGPDLPTRSVIGVAGLAEPEWLVKIEVTAVRTGD